MSTLPFEFPFNGFNVVWLGLQPFLKIWKLFGCADCILVDWREFKSLRKIDRCSCLFVNFQFEIHGSRFSTRFLSRFIFIKNKEKEIPEFYLIPLLRNLASDCLSENLPQIFYFEDREEMTNQGSCSLHLSWNSIYCEGFWNTRKSKLVFFWIR